MLIPLLLSWFLKAAGIDLGTCCKECCLDVLKGVSFMDQPNLTFPSREFDFAVASRIFTHLEAIYTVMVVPWVVVSPCISPDNHQVATICRLFIRRCSVPEAQRQFYHTTLVCHSYSIHIFPD